MRLKNSVYILLTFLLFSCETTEKIDDFPLRPAKLVVNCFFNADSTWEFQVSKSLSVLDNAEFKLIKNATISIFKEGELQTSFSSVGSDGWYRYSENLPEAGKEYSIKVTSPDFKDVLLAKDIVPVKPIITNTKLFISDSTFYNNGYFNYGYIAGAMELTISDPENTHNYYELELYALDSVFDYYSEPREFVQLQKRMLPISSDDLAADKISEISYSLLLNDYLFDGKEYKLSIDFSDYNAGRKKDYYISLKSITREGFLYRKTINEYLNSQNDPFSEPVIIYSNIENGLGIFSAFSQSVVAISTDF